MPKTRFKSRPKANYAVRLNAAKNQLLTDQVMAIMERDVRLTLIVLNREFGFGRERLWRFVDCWKATTMGFADDAVDVDAQYADDSIEREIKRILGARPE